jgi:hypothetical protein
MLMSQRFGTHVYVVHRPYDCKEFDYCGILHVFICTHVFTRVYDVKIFMNINMCYSLLTVESSENIDVN